MDNFYENYKRKPYRSFFMESFLKDTWKTMVKLTKIFRDNDINFTFLGGVTLGQYGYPRFTEDIDILVDRDDKEKMNNLPIGYIRPIGNNLKRFFWNDPKTKIDVIYTGEISGNNVNGLEYVSPNKISSDVNGIPVINLDDLIQYKISASLYNISRHGKDFLDVIELIKRNHLSKDFGIKFRSDIRSKYLQLWEESNMVPSIPEDEKTWNDIY